MRIIDAEKNVTKNVLTLAKNFDVILSSKNFNKKVQTTLSFFVVTIYKNNSPNIKLSHHKNCVLYEIFRLII